MTFDQREYSRRYYEKHRDELLAKHREYNRDYYWIHRERELRRKREHRQNHLEEERARIREYHRTHGEEAHSYYTEYKQKNPEKILARRRASHCTQLDEICKNCGSTESLERHHPDYSQPLQIVTLCRSCHITLHRS